MQWGNRTFGGLVLQASGNGALVRCERILPNMIYTGGIASYNSPTHGRAAARICDAQRGDFCGHSEYGLRCRY